mgnify:CR=1 FL=1
MHSVCSMVECSLHSDLLTSALVVCVLRIFETSDSEHTILVGSCEGSVRAEGAWALAAEGLPAWLSHDCEADGRADALRHVDHRCPLQWGISLLCTVVCRGISWCCCLAASSGCRSASSYWCACYDVRWLQLCVSTLITWVCAACAVSLLMEDGLSHHGYWQVEATLLIQLHE